MARHMCVSILQCDCKIDWLWVRSPLGEMKYLFTFIFLFLYSGVEAKRGVEFRHSTRNASRTRQKVENRELNKIFCISRARKLKYIPRVRIKPITISFTPSPNHDRPVLPIFYRKIDDVLIFTK